MFDRSRPVRYIEFVPGVRSLVQRVARALVWTFVAGLSMPALSAAHGADSDAVFCLENGVTASRSGLHLGDPAGRSDAGHCLLCHWTRAVSTATPMPATCAHEVLGATAVRVTARSLAPVTRVATDLSTRAPPACA